MNRAAIVLTAFLLTGCAAASDTSTIEPVATFPSVAVPPPSPEPTTSTSTPTKTKAATTATKTTAKKAPTTTKRTPRPASKPTTKRTTRRTTKPAPAPVKTVHPGAFCSPEGATGETSSGRKMKCIRKPGEDRARWRSA